MQTFTYSSSLDVPAEALFAWHERPGAFQRLTPPWAPVTLEHFEGIRDGQRAVLRLGPKPVGLRWVAEHHDYLAGRQFCDRQVEGPFAHWDHAHRVEPDGPAASVLTDHITYELPARALTAPLGGALFRQELARQFAYRHRVTRRDLALHRRYNPEGRALRIAVSGASGLLGSQLVAFLTTGGHDVRRLVRSKPSDPEREIYWDARKGRIEAEKLEGLDAVIHLAGENVFAPRWTQAKKQRIYASRVDGTRLISEALAGLARPPRVFLCASAIGYYGDRGRDLVPEEAASGGGFLAAVCRAWEDATAPAARAGIRTAQLRIGVVLTPAGGALQLMLPAFQLGLGGRLAAADPYVSWITLDDLLGATYHALLTDAVEGPLNLTAPVPVPMRTLARTLGHVLRRPALLAVPAPLLRALGGEMAEEVLLLSARVLPLRLQETGYPFMHVDLEAGLRHVLGRAGAGINQNG